MLKTCFVCGALYTGDSYVKLEICFVCLSRVLRGIYSDKQDIDKWIKVQRGRMHLIKDSFIKPMHSGRCAKCYKPIDDHEFVGDLAICSVVAVDENKSYPPDFYAMD